MNLSLQILKANCSQSAQDTESERMAISISVDRGGLARAVPVDQQAHLGGLGYTDRWARWATVGVHAVGSKGIFATMHGHFTYM